MEDAPASAKSRQCRAPSLNDCDGGISHEHVVFKCLFPNGEITVRGFPWCREKPKSFRIERLTHQIICAKHNNELSNLDAAVKQSLDTLKKAFISSPATAKRRRFFELR